MIIPNPVVKLDYNPSQDILIVEWPDFSDYTLSEAKYTLNVILETIRTYDVKYLLTDARKGTIDIPEQSYKELIYGFALSLTKTRLKKLARVVAERTLREKPIKEVTQKAKLAIPIKSFEQVEDALHWLTSSE